MKRIALFGAGRMAVAIAAVVSDRPGVEVAGAVARNQSSGAPFPIRPSLGELSGPVDVVIDFSLPAGTATAADWCAAQGTPLLSGVTGLDETAKNALDRAAKSAAVMWSPNMSLGVNLLAELCRQVAAALPAGTPVAIHDVHHQWKKDAPSGTALFLGQAVACAHPDSPGDIEYTSAREGEVVGRHTVTFQAEGEVLQLHHDAQDRGIFAAGAVDAALWLAARGPGRYTASDWIANRSLDVPHRLR